MPLDLQLPLHGWPFGQKEGSMTRKWTFVFIVAAILLLAMSISLAWSAPQRCSESTELSQLLLIKNADLTISDAIQNAGSKYMARGKHLPSG
jgi:hypothetical protein